jgi:hypothetical protein
MRRMMTLALSAAVALSATSAFAESLADTITSRSSTEAVVGLHMPLGGKAHQTSRATYGASLGFRAGGQTVSQSLNRPAAKIAEINFSGGKVEDAHVGAVNFVQNGTVVPKGERLGLLGLGPTTWLWIGVGAAIAWYVLDGNDDDNNDDNDAG